MPAYRFTHVFDQTATQEQIFELVAKGVVDKYASVS